MANWKRFGVKTYQAEDEMAGIGAALGASYGGSLGVTASSGPGIALKGEFLGLAVITELPLVVINVQRGGPSTGLPTKTEQSDLFQAVYGRNGEAPMPVIAASTPGDCYYTAYEACKMAVKYMTPVMMLSDGYLANGSEPWIIPNPDDLGDFDVEFVKENLTDEKYLPYKRNEKTLARGWAIPGTKGLEHRIGGIEKQDVTGDVNYDSDNHEKMVQIRAQKVANIANELPPTEVFGEKKGDLLILSWGSTHGTCKSATESLLSENLKVAHVSIRWISPLPNDLKDILSNYKKVLMPEINTGQFRHSQGGLLAQRLIANEVQGKPLQERMVCAYAIGYIIPEVYYDGLFPLIPASKCPGCGDYAILAQTQKTFPEIDVPKENSVFVSGIGCSSRFPYYMNTFGFHTIHGRAPSVATGVKLG